MNSRVTEIEQNVHKIETDRGILILTGTAHVSVESKNLVRRMIETHSPDTVCVELDEERYRAMTDRESYRKLDIVEIIKKKKLFFMIGQYLLSSYQRKMSEKTGSRPGEEFMEAITAADEKGSEIALVDRNIGITLKRAWRRTTFWQKLKFLFSMLLSDEDVSADEIERIKESDALENLIDEFGAELPGAKEVLIDERDQYLTRKIHDALKGTTVAIVGAGHVPGILRHFDTAADIDVSPFEEVPPASVTGKVIPWIFPVAVASLVIWGFTTGRRDMATEAIIYWVLANGSLTALGCLLALAHPFTVLAGFLAAPLTSLNPTIGAGFVTAFVQAVMVRPRISDLEELRDDVLKPLAWWRNRVTRIFLVFLLSSIGSSIGTFVALPYLLRIL